MLTPDNPLNSKAVLNNATPVMQHSGSFESDYLETCRSQRLTPWNILKFGIKLPPLPTGSADITLAQGSIGNSMLSASLIEESKLQQSQSVFEVPMPREAKQGKNKPSGHGVLGNLSKEISGSQQLSDDLSARRGSVMNVNAVGSISKKPQVAPLNAVIEAPKEKEFKDKDVKNIPMKPLTPCDSSGVYASRFKYNPTIQIETLETIEDEEVFRVGVRGYALSNSTLDIFKSIVPTCSNISSLRYKKYLFSFWNCKLDEEKFKTIVQIMGSANITNLAIDQNPVPDHLYSQLINEDSNLQTLSLRSNKITNTGCKLIAAQLKTNRRLISLSLFDNQISKDGAEALAEVTYASDIRVSKQHHCSICL